MCVCVCVCVRACVCARERVSIKTPVVCVCVCVVVDCFYTGLFSALEQIHCTLVICDFEWVTSWSNQRGHMRAKHSWSSKLGHKGKFLLQLQHHLSLTMILPMTSVVLLKQCSVIQLQKSYHDINHRSRSMFILSIILFMYSLHLCVHVQMDCAICHGAILKPFWCYFPWFRAGHPFLTQ